MNALSKLCCFSVVVLQPSAQSIPLHHRNIFFPRGCYGQLFERLPAFRVIHFKCLRHLRSAAIFYRLDLVRSSSGNLRSSRLRFLPILAISKSLAPYFPLCAKEVSCSFFKESKLKTKTLAESKIVPPHAVPTSKQLSKCISQVNKCAYLRESTDWMSS